jgi:integrase
MRRVCAWNEQAKNSAKAVKALSIKAAEGEKRDAGATETIQSQTDVKGKIVEYAWWMQKQGYSPLTIESRIKKLKRLINLGANLLDPENVKDVIAKQPWKTSTKAQVSNIYGCFAKLNRLEWVPPIYKPNYELPFIPTEAEIDQLIAACGKKLSALLQLLKETGIRIGEACRLRWIDLDVEQKTLRVQAEKNSNPRIFRISDKLIAMLNRLPRKSERIFPSSPRSLETWFRVARNRIALKLGNPRLREIRFHTIRHWRATMLYHQTKDILHVKEFLGHRSLDSTLTYINIERAIFGCPDSSEFHVKVAQTPEEIKALLEVGFEYVCEKDGLLFFRKRK